MQTKTAISFKNEKLLDKIGWKILCELQEDARMSFSELGKAVGLSTPAVTERVKKMEDAGIITGYRAQVNPATLGYPITAFIRLNIVGDVFTRITKVVREMPEVRECHRGTGSDSFTIKINVSSVEQLEELIDRLTPFGTTSTSIVLSSPVLGRIIDQPPPDVVFGKSGS